VLHPGGLFVFSENLPRRNPYRTETQAVRPEAEVKGIVERAGFEIVDRRPIYFLMNNPVNSESRMHRLWWRDLATGLDVLPRTGFVVGACLYPLELALVNIVRRAPSTELVVCRKVAGTPS
jgi:hypothetical protein